MRLVDIDAKQHPTWLLIFPFSLRNKQIRAQLDRDDTSNVVFKRGFTVNNVVDLNENPQAAVSSTCPISTRLNRHFLFINTENRSIKLIMSENSTWIPNAFIEIIKESVGES